MRDSEIRYSDDYRLSFYCIICVEISFKWYLLGGNEVGRFVHTVSHSVYISEYIQVYYNRVSTVCLSFLDVNLSVDLY